MTYLILIHIMETVTEIFVCPEHFLIYIPGVVLETTSCIKEPHHVNDTKEKLKLKLKTIISKIHILLKNSNDKYNHSKHKAENKEYNSIHKIKWLLEGTLSNFNYMYDESGTFYNKLSGSYSILNNTEINEIEKKNMTHVITLEEFVIIETNIEHCNTILTLLNTIDSKDYELMLHLKNNYMICIITDLLESIRMYKYNMCKLIN